MNGYLFIAAFSMLVGGIFSIATSSIAINCYNKNEKTKEETPSNFNFLIFNLVCAILLVLIGCISIYFAFKPSKKVVEMGGRFGLDPFVRSQSDIRSGLESDVRNQIIKEMKKNEMIQDLMKKGYNQEQILALTG